MQMMATTVWLWERLGSFALKFGFATVQIGPFELDPATRRSLDNALGLGGSRCEPVGREF